MGVQPDVRDRARKDITETIEVCNERYRQSTLYMWEDCVDRNASAVEQKLHDQNRHNEAQYLVAIQLKRRYIERCAGETKDWYKFLTLTFPTERFTMPATNFAPSKAVTTPKQASVAPSSAAFGNGSSQSPAQSKSIGASSPAPDVDMDSDAAPPGPPVIPAVPTISSIVDVDVEMKDNEPPLETSPAPPAFSHDAPQDDM
jgi:hypothetical protein